MGWFPPTAIFFSCLSNAREADWVYPRETPYGSWLYSQPAITYLSVTNALAFRSSVSDIGKYVFKSNHIDI